MDKQYIGYNNQLLCNKEVINFHNRAFLFGDGFFETYKVINSQILFTEFHLPRIHHAFATLNIITPDLVEVYKLVKLLLKKNDCHSGRVRITFFRDGEGKYLPNSNKCNYLITTENGTNVFSLNTTGLTIGKYTQLTKSTKSPLENIKYIGNHISVQAALFAQKNNLNDCILINEQNNITQCISSNIFIVKNTILYTPDKNQGINWGSMRGVILEIAAKNGIKIIKTTISQKFIEDADEIFLTNAIKGIQWVKTFESCSYTNTISSKLMKELQKRAFTK